MDQLKSNGVNLQQANEVSATVWSLGVAKKKRVPEGKKEAKGD